MNVERNKRYQVPYGTWYRCLIVLGLVALFSVPAFAETIELVTYYPAPGGGNVSTDRLHARAGTIGPPYSLTDPAVLPDGHLLVWDRLGVGIGLNPPAGPLHVVGRDDTPERVLFLPGADTGAQGTPEIRVGIGLNNPTTRLAVGGLLQSQIAQDARYNVQLGYLVPSGMPSIGFSANLHAETTVNLVSNTRPARAVVITAADDALSFSRNANGAAQDAAAFNPTVAPHPMMVMKLDSGNVGIGTLGPAGRLHVQGADDAATNVLLMPGADTAVAGTPEIRMGIGTAAPATELEVVSTRVAQPRGILSSQYNTGGNSALFIGRKARGTLAAPIAVANGDFLTGLIPEAYDGANYQQTGWAGFKVNGAVAGGSVPSDFIVFTGAANQGTEKFRVTSAGNVGIGTTGPAQRLDVAGNIRFGSDGGLLKTKSPGNYPPGKEAVLTVRDGGVPTDPSASDDDEIWIGPNVGSYRGYIQLSAAHITVRGGEVFPSSDGRLKAGIAAIPNALDRVSALQGVNFRWKDDRFDKRLKMGLVAQEVEPVFPELVHTDAEGSKMVDYPLLTAALVEAVKELKAQNEAQQREIEELKRQVAR